MPASVGTVYMDVAYNTAAITKDLTAASTAAGTSAASALSQTFERRLVAMGGKTAEVGKKMSVGLSLPLVGLGALAVKEFTGYEKSLTNIEALVGASREQTQAYAEDIRRVGVEFGVGAQAAGEALYFITSSGFEGAAAIEVLNESAKAAASGLGELPVVADLVTSAINAYGAANLSAAEATDILTVAVREGKGDPAELAGAMSSVLPVASALGVQFDEVAGAMASMSLTGTSADEAATQLRGILNALNKPSAQAEEALAGVGLSSKFLREQIAERGLLPVLNELTKALGDDSAATALVFEDVRALTGVMNILGEKTAQTEAIFQSTANSTGALNDAFDIASQSSGFKLDQAMAQLKDSLIEVGAVVVPIFAQVAGGVAKLTSAFSSLPGPVQTVLVGLGGLVAVAGPLLFVGGKLVSTFGKLVSAAEKFANAGIDRAIGSIGKTSETASSQVSGLNTNMSKTAQVAGAGAIALGGLFAAWTIWDNKIKESEAASQTQADLLFNNVDSIAAAEDKIRRAGVEMNKINDAVGSSFSPLDQDWRTELSNLHGQLRANGEQLVTMVAQARELQAATGDNADETFRWLEAQRQTGTTYASTEDALKAYNKAVAEGGVVQTDAASATAQANTAFDEQRKAVAGLQSVFLGVIDGGTAYQDALDGIADAQRSADMATRRVGDAQRGYRDSLRAVEDAQDSYADSLRGVEDAQQGVIDAQRALDDALSGTSVDDELSLEGARIRLAEAQETMNAGDFEGDLDRRRAALALRQAEVDLARLEEQVAGRPGEREADLADAQARLTAAQVSAEDAARGVEQANFGVGQAALAVRDAQYEQARSTQGVAEAQDNAVRAALDLAAKQGDLAVALRDEEGAASDLLSELLFLQGTYPELAAAMQPYIDKLRVLQALRRGAVNPNAGAPFAPDSGFSGPQGYENVPQVGDPFSPESGFTGPMGGVVINGYHRAPEDILNEAEQRARQAVSTLAVF